MEYHNFIESSLGVRVTTSHSPEVGTTMSTVCPDVDAGEILVHLGGGK
jgi:hypothetical protein